MIRYDAKRPWKYLCIVTGSTIPKAFKMAFPSSVLCLGCRAAFVFGGFEVPEVSIIDTSVITIFGSILGFLIVFRTGQAYSRFWEGASLIVQIRGEWYQAVSSLFAFCSKDPHLKGQVLDFQDLMVRLMSLLYAAALQRISNTSDSYLEVIDPGSLDDASLETLASDDLKCEIIMQWMQQAVVQAIEQKVIVIAAPISSRVFQELSRGMVALNSVEKVARLPFPMPYAQMVWLMLLLFSVVYPLACAVFTDLTRCGLYTFFCTLVYWCVHFIAVEIEMPFGDDPNDLPVREFQEEMNSRLESLLVLRNHLTVKLRPGRSDRRSDVRVSRTGIKFAEQKALTRVRSSLDQALKESATRTKSLLLGAATMEAIDQQLFGDTADHAGLGAHSGPEPPDVKPVLSGCGAGKRISFATATPDEWEPLPWTMNDEPMPFAGQLSEEEEAVLGGEVADMGQYLGEHVGDIVAKLLRRRLAQVTEEPEVALSMSSNLRTVSEDARKNTTHSVRGASGRAVDVEGRMVSGRI
eukprot:CAMPEP_0197897788 /NCGR_PEP_ID=MMETSP1439-20131203/42422_1 /TAXON_ID=66791 /ORGANISM="Gonyaulax spinifera, Strain CCMP409" /LENGTH=522 /DNA_ID=CAMNT_0043518441 /DNA_START=51 /DNA_END=1616 /DNA_ORIENTATION=+